MHRWSLLRLLSLTSMATCLAGSLALGQTTQSAMTDGGITVYFSPQGGATQAIVDAIAQARDSIRVQAYSFSSAPIAKALVDAHKRGVKVVAVLDKSQATFRYSGATFLYNAGVPVLIDADHAIAHNKIMIIDGKTVITGSFNFTKAAEESNAENLVVFKDHPAVAAAYLQNFDRHLQHATKYEGLKGTASGSEATDEADDANVPAVQVAPPSPKASSGPQGSPRESGNVIVHVTKSGKKYHREGCTSLAQSDIPMQLVNAKAKGYTPCARCKPAP